ncbi:uncharacterized protein FOMMEDRAFT_21024 [Fomitiporia mediterranea MF3/22]|uniref:uncharacterized protein n=1 Tax=Fomitiporia mediterranea (strain MF3/22) TaxID=694068 RepID=UPI00044078B2|nr:uncharacterized protein FOMMEDRAFT_21024 [Fomitiporia mediterranea MF3/22]EJD02268.1 hypothetical protein FOMMEDRAFT_21024 [Fomitiporia mediterranea MF3/22]
MTACRALPTANGFLLLCLTLYKAAEFPRRSEGFKGFELVRIIAQDQMIYFCWFMLLAVLRIVSLTIKNRTAAVFLLSTSNPASLCILGDLLLINLKEAGSRLLCDRTNYGTSYLIEEIEISRLS